MKILVTRPEPEATLLATALHRAGHEVVVAPLFDIILLDSSALRAAFLVQSAALKRNKRLIFVSKNAVRGFVKSFKEGIRLDPRVREDDTDVREDDTDIVDDATGFAVDTTAFAVGPGTAQLLESYGIHAIAPSSAEGSEALLALPELQCVSGQHFVVVAGKEGRQKIHTILRERGATVENLIVYAAEPRNLSSSEHEAFKAEYDLAIITSPRALERAVVLGLKPSTRLSVLSENMLNLALQFGFSSFLRLSTGEVADIMTQVGALK
jgi:uroporphyrinogen-III synthase